MIRKSILAAVVMLSACSTTPAYASFGSDHLMRMCESRGGVYLVSAAAKLAGQPFEVLLRNADESGIDAATRIAVYEAYADTESTDAQSTIEMRANRVVMRCYRSGGQR